LKTINSTQSVNYFFEHLFQEFQLPLKNPVLVFSLLLFIILLSPILLRKIRIPAIIGLIISGVIIGPKGLGLIGEGALDKEGSIKLFSTIGLLYIMFMAGLELDMNEFKRYLKKSLAFGAFTFFVPILLGFPLCYYVLDLSETASWLTASMFATHTLVAYPIMSKYGLTKHTAVAIAVGGTILTDTAVLIILAVISSSTKGQLDSSFWFRLITSLTIFSLIMFFLIPRIARWFFSKLDSEKASQYIFVLSVVFFAAFLAEVAGVEGIIGAFVAGLVLNRLIPHNSILMNRVEFIGNALFIPFFLIFVGMVVDYRAFFQGSWPLIIAGVLTTFALFSKWLAAFLTQLVFRMTGTERQVIFGLSASHAAATLAIIMVGYKIILNQPAIDAAKKLGQTIEPERLLNDNVLNGTVLLILITCMVASFVTENAGKKLLILKAESEDDEPKGMRLRNKHLLVAMNELSGNEQVMDFSLMVSDPKVINPISVVSVHPNNEDAERLIRRSRKSLEEIVKHFSGYEAKINTIATIDYNVSSGIARVAKELVSDIVVLNDNSRMNILKRLVGDDREHLMDVCDKTIFFCNFEKPFVSATRILVTCPPFAELESSFVLWVERVLRFSKELNVKLELYATTNTHDKWKRVAEDNKLNVETHWTAIEELDDFFLLNSKKQSSDIIIYCSARPGSVSYSPNVELFPSKLEKAFPKNDYLLIFPSQQQTDPVYGSYEDIDSTAISRGVEAIQKIGKEVGNIFKKGSQKE
jgi:Kef-type K+ transport system membrane component KefB